MTLNVNTAHPQISICIIHEMICESPLVPGEIESSAGISAIVNIPVIGSFYGVIGKKMRNKKRRIRSNPLPARLLYAT